MSALMPALMPAGARLGSVPHRWALAGAGCLLLGAGVGLVWASPASAAPTGTEEGAGQITDTHGVPLENYRTLPLDRGDVWSAEKWFPAALMDLIWGVHLTMVELVFPLLHLLLSFEWIEWIIAPVTIVAENIQHVTSQLHWIPVAAMILGGAVVLWIIRGRTGAGITELVIGSVMIVLAGGVLANPVQWITGPDGVFTTAQQYGGQAAVEITTDPGNPPPANLPIQEALNHTILSQLTDLFVRIPAQSVTFGHALDGECDQIFTNNMITVDPIDVADTTVRTRVSSCDSSAKTYVESPALTKVFPPVVVAGGGSILIILALIMAVLFFLAVVFALYHGVKQMISVLIAILPGTSRRGFFRSFVSVFVYGILVGLLMVVIACYLMMLVWVAKATSALGIVLQMGLVIVLVVVLIVLLLVIWRRSVRSGQKLADRLASLGLGGTGPAPRPARFNPVGTIEPYVRDAINRKLLTRGPDGHPPAPTTTTEPADPAEPEQQPPATSHGRSFTTPAPASVSLPGRGQQQALPVSTARPQAPGDNPGPAAPNPQPGPRTPTGGPSVGPTGSPSGGPIGGPGAPAGTPASAKALRGLSTGLSLVGGPTAVAGGILARGAAGMIEHRSHRSQRTTAPLGTSPALDAPGSRARPQQPPPPWVSPQGRRIEVDAQGQGRVVPAAVEGRIVPASQGPPRPTQHPRTTPSPETQARRRRIAQARMAAAVRKGPVGTDP